MLNSITRILDQAHKPDSSIRPTELYNEGWMLRVVLDWFANNSSDENNLDHPFTFQKGAMWYSEAILPTHFKPRTKSGDKVAESRTHADGVIGHFQIQENTKAGFQLLETATQFIVVEAEMRSKLSHRTINIDYWDQASRNVACMAEAIARADAQKRLNNESTSDRGLIEQLKHIGFYVTAPEEQFRMHDFGKLLSKESIGEKTEKRILDYYSYHGLELGNWHEQYFIPLVSKIHIKAIGWESIIEFIRELDPVNVEGISSFYDYCLEFN